MKKKGFVLIELISALAILSIILAAGFKGYKYYKKHIHNIACMSDLYDIREILSFSKEYCFEHKVCGELYFDNSEELSNIYLQCHGTIIKRLSIINKGKIKNSNCIINDKKMMKVDINKDGYMSPCTIIFIDEEGKEKKIIIQVGGNMIYIKDE